MVVHRFRFPDKPRLSGPAILSRLVPGDWVAQVKHDGWRALVRWDGRGVSLTSSGGNPIPVLPALRQELEALLTGFPRGTMLDAEWLGRRRLALAEPQQWNWGRHRSASDERLVLFDLLALGGDWAGEVGAGDRFRFLREIWRVRPVPRLRHVRLVEWSTRSYAALYERSKAIPSAEGIVLKHVASRYIGAPDRCAINELWLKVKHRHGAAAA